jgi:hypothetical protein
VAPNHAGSLALRSNIETTIAEGQAAAERQRQAEAARVAAEAAAEAAAKAAAAEAAREAELARQRRNELFWFN